MHQIERYFERLLDFSSANLTITTSVVFVGGIGLLWVICNGWSR